MGTRYTYIIIIVDVSIRQNAQVSLWTVLLVKDANETKQWVGEERRKGGGGTRVK